MNILVIGNGGREHAILWKLAQSSIVESLYCYPGSAGTSAIAENIDVANNDENWQALINICQNKKIDWVFVGPEQPLSEGVVDALAAAGIPAFGPHAQAAKLESSKQFSKEFMVRNGLPTAAASVINNEKELTEYIDAANGKMLVLKKSGLAAGKGVLESSDRETLLDFGQKVLESDSLVAEEYLTGYEVSLFTLGNDSDYLLLPSCADYKKAGDNNTGPNTGGMGAICPVPWFDDAMLARAKKEIIEPTHQALRKEGLAYCGVLYFGLMITQEGPKLLEYNVRLGDPEAEILMPMIDGDLVTICHNLLKKEPIDIPSKPAHGCAVTVVAAAPGYPSDYKKGIPVEITPLSQADKNQQTEMGTIFHASTITDAQGQLLTNGGRCFAATGWGSNTDDARGAAYNQVERINFDGVWYRKDIGTRVGQNQ